MLNASVQPVPTAAYRSGVFYREKRGTCLQRWFEHGSSRSAARRGNHDTTMDEATCACRRQVRGQAGDRIAAYSAGAERHAAWNIDRIFTPQQCASVRTFPNTRERRLTACQLIHRYYGRINVRARVTQSSRKAGRRSPPPVGSCVPFRRYIQGGSKKYATTELSAANCYIKLSSFELPENCVYVGLFLAHLNVNFK